MSSATSTPIRHVNYNDEEAASREQPHQALEVRLRFLIRLMALASAGVSNQILHETAPIPLESVVFPLPLHELHDDPVFFQMYIAQLLSSLNISAAASEVIGGQIASIVLQMAEENSREMNFHVVAIVYTIQCTWMAFPVLNPVPVRVGGTATVVPEEFYPRTVQRFRMEKLLEENINNNGEEDMGNCSVCLDDMNCKKREVVKIPCGHVYHESCIFKWLRNSNSCPLCRTPVPVD